MTTPSPQVNQAKLGVGFDCDSKIGEDAAAELFQAGFQFACRYVPLWDSSGADAIDQDEALIILNSGMDLRLVQHAHMPGWAPSRQLGALDGQAAVIAAQKAGYLPGATLWCDCEGVSGSAGSEDLTSYLTAWASAALAAGFKAGLYIGADVPLSPMQLYKLYGFDQYWSGANVKLSVATRGYSTIQLWPPVTMAGLELDIDITTPDMLGGLPFELSSWPT